MTKILDCRIWFEFGSILWACLLTSKRTKISNFLSVTLNHLVSWKANKTCFIFALGPSYKLQLIRDKMLKNLLVLFLVVSFAVASPVPEDKEGENPRAIEDRGLIEDLLINLIRDMVINQINSILGITTTTTPCGGLLGGGLLCPWKIHWKFLDFKLLNWNFMLDVFH